LCFVVSISRDARGAGERQQVSSGRRVKHICRDDRVIEATESMALRQFDKTGAFQER
jgi:hypothetical protein